jgi:hypothetical protein
MEDARMNTRTKAIIAAAAAGTLVLGAVGATALAADAPDLEVLAAERAAAPVSAVNLWGTTYAIPENIVGFYFFEDRFQHTGDVSDFDQSTLDAINAQVTAAPANTVVFVDRNSLGESGLTMAQTTVVPTTTDVGAFPMATTNEQAQAWLAAQFPEVEGAVASQPIALVANASFTYTQSTDGVDWTTTEYLFQFADAAVTVTLHTTGPEAGIARAQFEAMFAAMTR